MEGINILAILLGYLAVFIVGLTSLAALVLLIAGKPRQARIVFAGGFLVAALGASVGVLSFLTPQYIQGESPLALGLAALAILVGGSGLFVAALRGPWRFTLALACLVASLFFLGAGFGGDFMAPVLEILRTPAGNEHILFTGAGLLFAALTLLPAFYPG